MPAYSSLMEKKKRNWGAQLRVPVLCWTWIRDWYLDSCCEFIPSCIVNSSHYARVQLKIFLTAPMPKKMSKKKSLNLFRVVMQKSDVKKRYLPIQSFCGTNAAATVGAIHQERFLCVHKFHFTISSFLLLRIYFSLDWHAPFFSLQCLLTVCAKDKCPCVRFIVYYT